MYRANFYDQPAYSLKHFQPGYASAIRIPYSITPGSGFSSVSGKGIANKSQSKGSLESALSQQFQAVTRKQEDLSRRIATQTQAHSPEEFQQVQQSNQLIERYNQMLESFIRTISASLQKLADNLR